LVQGDTTTVFAAALAAFYRRIPVGHVEAGLRSDDRFRPYPEEVNRRMVTSLSDLHFAPTELAKARLLREGVPEDAIEVTGNTSVDAVLAIAARELGDPVGLVPDRPLIVVTIHRREAFGAGLRGIFSAIARIARERAVQIVYPVHPNPNVRELATELLADTPHVHLVPPLSYGPFVALLKRAHLVLSDSGGIQEEAPALDVPVLVAREVTERPEGIAAGVSRLVGLDTDTIVQTTLALLDDPAAHAAMARAPNPYGDGTAATRITHRTLRFLK
jgi:UDP-N-acetylglucosamine 2-epimerase (non-hydrolysing)